MPSKIYRYTFTSDVCMADVEGILMHAVESIEDLHGEAAARLDARYFFDPDRQRCVIDATTPIGVELNKLFAGKLAREFGPDSFRIERLNAFPAAPVALEN